MTKIPDTYLVPIPGNDRSYTDNVRYILLENSVLK